MIDYVIFELSYNFSTLKNGIECFYCLRALKNIFLKQIIHNCILQHKPVIHLTNWLHLVK